MTDKIQEFIGLPNVTIYDHPKDYPDQYAARKFMLDQPTDEVFADADLEKVRDWARTRFGYMPHKLNRSEADDPSF